MSSPPAPRSRWKRHLAIAVIATSLVLVLAWVWPGFFGLLWTLPRAEARWRRNRPACYEIVVTDAQDMSSTQYRLHVIGDRVALAEFRGAQSPREEFEPITGGWEMGQPRVPRLAVPGLFDRARTALSSKSPSHADYTVTFDPKWGYPTRIHGRAKPGVCDGGSLVEVVSFRVLERSEVRESPCLPGSQLAVWPLVRDEFAFIAVCEATGEPSAAKPGVDRAGLITQRFHVTELLAGQTRGQEILTIAYACEETEDYSERPVADGERVLWIARLDSGGRWSGVKALYPTSINRWITCFNAGWAPHQTWPTMSQFPWVHAVDGLRCRLGMVRSGSGRTEEVWAVLEIQNVGSEAIALWSDLDLTRLALLKTRVDSGDANTGGEAAEVGEPLVLKPGETHRLRERVGAHLPRSGLQRPRVCSIVWRGHVRIGSPDASPIPLVSNPVTMRLKPPVWRYMSK